MIAHLRKIHDQKAYTSIKQSKNYEIFTPNIGLTFLKAFETISI
jgi:hypothetical protein